MRVDLLSNSVGWLQLQSAALPLDCHSGLWRRAIHSSSSNPSSLPHPVPSFLRCISSVKSSVGPMFRIFANWQMMIWQKWDVEYWHIVRHTEHCTGYFDMAIIILSSAETAGADYRSHTSQESRQRKTAHRPLARDPADSDDDGARLLKLSN